MKPGVFLALLGGLSVGLATGWLARGLSAPDTLPTAPAAPYARNAAPLPVAAPAPSGNQALDACQTELDLARRVLEAQRVAEEGTPVAFPDDLPPEHTAEGFKANLEQAMIECELGGTELSFTDCSEYPCLAVFDGGRGQMLKQCGWWQARYPNRGVTSSTGNVHTEDGPRHYSVMGEHAPGVRPDDNQSKRVHRRFEALKAELMGRWDGFEPTDDEKAEQQRAFWEAVAEKGGEQGKMAEGMLDMLDARE